MTYCIGDRLYCPKGVHRGNVVSIRGSYVGINKPGLTGILMIPSVILKVDGWRNRQPQTLADQLAEK